VLSSDQPALEPRVVVLIHDPVIEREGGRKLHDVLGWHDPDLLARLYIQDVAEASHGRVRYRIVERIEVDGYPVKQDGFRYDDESYLRCWRRRAGFHQPDAVDYLRLLNSAGFPAKVEAAIADELWLFAFPYAGYYESIMGGRQAIWCNSPPLAGTGRASRRFVVMGFNYERDLGCMLENLGHRAESILEHVFDRARSNLWREFARFDKTSPGRAGCGNVHFAPNSDHDYDWGNPRPVPSSCDDWLNYPNLRGITRRVDCSEWGKGDMREHHLWWLRHLPHADGRTASGVAHNWWQYVVGLDWP